jgi:predicted secreted protein
MKKALMLQQRLKDSRSLRVVFLSHCILNENTRYLGGACRGGCVREIVQQCLDNDWGIVQMPCPEQHAWGGVTKRLLLIPYGAKDTLVYRFRSLLLPLFVRYTNLVYRRLARAVADQINDYLLSGFTVIGIIGIDGSPSCGVGKTLSLQKSFDLTASIDVESYTVDAMNAIVRQCIMDGKGLFTAMLQEELKKRRLDVRYVAHDLIGEIDGKTFSAGILLSV